ncbi:tRNA preQ1(34) S-adenosylmethionine ribosyltransferase-isomerase QueA [Opitutales bacterium]|nr:tRNA preQ1(34) S-adenosylmethionine ribosyltransferase-isomerase QueA [Opitutales bacterium]
MLTEDLNYKLPPQLIAQSPAERRDHSRLLLFHRSTQTISHHHFHELPRLLPPNLSIFRNDVSVLKARIFGKRPTGGQVECLLLRPDSPSETTWQCLLKPGGKTAKNGTFGIENEYSAEVLKSLPSGEYIVRFDLPKDTDPTALAQRIGALPLPPYVRRPANQEDEKRYQTVYADREKCSAVAAPTAGLHFTPESLNTLKKDGHSIYDLTLSVGLGTFRPVETKRIEDHAMHAEKYVLPPATKSVLRDPSKKKLAIGTTCVRAIEHYLQTDDLELFKSTEAESNLFICPPYHFRGINHLLTNFHLPGSTLMCLVGSFLNPNKSNGISLLKKIYHEAIRENYRFFSFGDAMLII